MLQHLSIFVVSLSFAIVIESGVTRNYTSVSPTDIESTVEIKKHTTGEISSTPTATNTSTTTGATTGITTGAPTSTEELLFRRDCNLTGYFGERCKFECHCQDGPAACNDLGVCDGNCTTGWSGPSCQIPCPNGTYGYKCLFDCSETCENRTCHTETGFCYCDFDAPEIGCTRRPDDFGFLLTSFWLAVVGAALIIAFLIICIGSSACCRKRFTGKTKEKKVFNFKIERARLLRKRGSVSTTNGEDPLALSTTVRLRLSSLGASMKANRNVVHGSRQSSGGAMSNAQRRGSHCVDGEEKESHVSSSASRVPGPDPAIVAKHLENVMPGYKVQRTNSGHMKLVRKEPTNPVIRGSMARIMRQRVIKAQEKVRQRPQKSPDQHQKEEPGGSHSQLPAFSSRAPSMLNLQVNKYNSKPSTPRSGSRISKMSAASAQVK